MSIQNCVVVYYRMFRILPLSCFSYTASHSTTMILRYNPVETRLAKNLNCQQRLLKQLFHQSLQYIARIEVKKGENSDVEEEEEVEEIGKLQFLKLLIISFPYTEAEEFPVSLQRPLQLAQSISSSPSLSLPLSSSLSLIPRSYQGDEFPP
jgi:hypothetical protein